MKRKIQVLIFALASAGLVFSGCDKPAEEPAETEEAAPEAPAEEEAAEEEVAEEEAAEVNEDMYVNAAFEVTCVNAQIEDPARAAEIKNEIYPRYGFTEESFTAAQEQMAERESVKMAIETRMEKCTAEMAEGLAEAGAPEGEEAAGEEAAAETGSAATKKAAPKPIPAKTGAMSGNFGGGGFEEASIRLTVRPDFKVSGQVRGNREGAAFAVPFSGEVSRSGDISATGERDGNTVRVSGKLTANGASGKLEGSVHQRDYSVNYNAN